jgi:formylglycine-generating enzyme required for sulfatase activity
MGSPTNEQARSANEGPQTLVTLTNGFLMGRYEITVGEFVAYTNFPSVALTNSFKVPADSVSWLMASNYCAWRTDYERQNGMISSNWYYRLPTEAEWEYACRAGSTNAFGIGTGMELRNDALRQDASFLGSFPYPTNLVAVGAIAQAAPAVGSYAPNAFGLYDMHGSTRELCWDYLGISLPGGSVTNLVGSVGEGFNGVRGGSSDDPASDCRSARRKMVQSSIRLTRADFRVVLVIDE